MLKHTCNLALLVAYNQRRSEEGAKGKSVTTITITIKSTTIKISTITTAVLRNKNYK